MAVNSQKSLLVQIEILLEPFLSAANGDLDWRQFLEALGWEVEAIAGFPAAGFLERLTQFAESYQHLIDLIDDPPETLPELQAALSAINQLYEAIRQLHTVLNQADAPPQFNRLGRDLINARLVDYLETWHPLLYHLLILLTLIRLPEDTPLPEPVRDSAGNVLRLPVPRPVPQFERLPDLISDPVKLLKAEYLEADGLTTAAAAKRTSDRLFPRLSNVFQELGISSLYGLKSAYGFDFGAVGNALGAGMLTLFADSDVEDSHFGVTLALSSADRGALGLVVVPFSNFDYSRILGEWELAVQLTAGVRAFALGSQGFILLAGPDTARVQAQLSLTKLAEGEAAAFLVGSTTGTRLEIGQFRISGDVSLSSSDQDYGLLLEVGSAALVIAPGDGDSFLRELLPSQGARTNFDLALGWSNQKGLYFRGSAGLEAELPVQASLADTLSIERVHLALGTRDGDVRAMIAATIAAKLGPITAVIERLGLQAIFTFPEEGGNLGPLDLSLGFKFPDGIGLLIDAGPITGGGFLKYEEETGRYAGALELEIYDISVKAIGLLDTRIPGGRPAYSFLILISTEFSPIPLGFGFTLNGVGGLAGIHRRIVVEELRDRLRQNSLDHILFPENPIRDAARIISDLQAVFPPAEDRYVFGPMAIIGWGKPTLLEGELGILLELPEPARLVLLGQFRLALPRKEKAIVELNLDLIGEIDQERRRIALDGCLRDSRVASFPIQGDIAMRLIGGDEPNFALSIGGFHPDYRPPADFPKLKRVTIPIGLDDNPRITLTGYLALTSNTLQIGAAGELYAEAGWFNIKGEAGFNALFTFSPFSFETDFCGRVALRKDDTVLAALKLEATLSGPTPWHAFGEVCLEIRWAPDICVDFDARFGSEEQVELPRVDPWPLLRDAVQNPESWSGARPSGVFRGATLARAHGALLDPACAVTLRQTVVPLNRRISKFGEAEPPAGSDRFDVTQVGVTGNEISRWSVVEDFFAPAQFEQLRDDEKLSRPSFERMDAGLSLGREAVNHGAAVGTRVEYETKIVDSAFETRQGGLYLPGLDLQMATLARSSAANAPLRLSGSTKFSPLQAMSPLVALGQERFVVASTLDLGRRSEITPPTSKGTAFQALADYLASHPNEQGQLEVFALDELAEEA